MKFFYLFFSFFSYDIGIDLGTTNSCVVIMEGKTPKVLENAEGLFNKNLSFIFHFTMFTLFNFIIWVFSKMALLGILHNFTCFSPKVQLLMTSTRFKLVKVHRVSCH